MQGNMTSTKDTTELEKPAEELREERQRTGRYIATTAAILLSVLGLYEAVVRGVPQYAAIIAPALIMFIYILWILNASKKQRKSSANKRKDAHPVRVEINPAENTKDSNENASNKNNCNKDAISDNKIKNCSRTIYSRSYSIA